MFRPQTNYQSIYLALIIISLFLLGRQNVNAQTAGYDLTFVPGSVQVISPGSNLLALPDPDGDGPLTKADISAGDVKTGVQINALIKNIGTRKSDSVKVCVVVWDCDVVQTVSKLNPGESRQVAFVVKGNLANRVAGNIEYAFGSDAGGRYQTNFSLVIDPDEKSADTNPYNNWLDDDIEVTVASPDLIISDVVPTTTQVIRRGKSTSKVTYAVTIKNIGETTPYKNINLSLINAESGGAYVTKQFSVKPAPGKTAVVQFTVTGGAFRVENVTIPLGFVVNFVGFDSMLTPAWTASGFESNYDNNQSTESFEIAVIN